MRNSPDGYEDNAKETDWRVLDLALARLVNECGHKQASRSDDDDGPGELQRAAPAFGLQGDICAEGEVEQARKQDVNVTRAVEEAWHSRHALEVALIYRHVLAGQ